MKNIKPIIYHTIHIKSLSSYQDFLLKRPKHTLNFKFSMLQLPNISPQANEKNIPRKLLKALKIVRSIPKVDFRLCEVLHSHLWKAKLLSTFKQISHVKTLFLMRPSKNSEEKYFKLFKRLQHLIYYLDTYAMTGRPPSSRFENFQHPLEYLKYCPKVKLLKVYDRSERSCLAKTWIHSKHHLRSLEYLAITARLLNEKQMNLGLPIESYKNLKSLYLDFYYLLSQDSVTKIMKTLSELPNLEEVGLRIKIKADSSFITALQNISQKKRIRKISLHLDLERSSSNLQRLLETLKGCKLTCFSLEVFIETKQDLTFISNFLKAMDHLESLKLEITMPKSCATGNICIDICKQISKLQALHSLQLNFKVKWIDIQDTATAQNFVPELSDLFTKQIKIETLHLACSFIDPSEALQSLILALGNSATFLKNLTINFGDFPCTKKTYLSALKLMQNLSSIQELAISDLKITRAAESFLDHFAQAIHLFRDLRFLKIGQIDDTVDISTLFRGIERILSKRGLRAFHCQDDHKTSRVMDMTKLRKMNPCLEFTSFNDQCNSILSHMRFWVETYQWTQ